MECFSKMLALADSGDVDAKGAVAAFYEFKKD